MLYIYIYIYTVYIYVYIYIYRYIYIYTYIYFSGFPDASGVKKKNPPVNRGDMGSIPGPGGSHMPQSN